MKQYFLIGISLFWVFSVKSGIHVDKITDLASALNETSGIEFYKGKYILSINDSGNKNDLYVLDTEGKILRKIEIKDASNEDWEELTQSDDGRIFIGDIGNNENKRKQCQIYIIPKDFLKGDDDIKADKLSFVYEDQTKFPPSEKELNYDAEAMFWMNDSIYIFTKCRTKPFSGRSFIYVLPDKPGKYKARKIGEIPFCSAGWMFCSVTAADYDSKSHTLAVLLYSKLVLISDFPGNQFWKGKMKMYNLSAFKQREAITFIDAKSWYMTDEKHAKMGGGNLYKVTIDKKP